MGRKQSPQTRRIPQRTCVVCRKTDSKRALVRLVRTAEAGVQVDPTGKRNGRGAYLCSDRACWQQSLGIDDPEKAFQSALSSVEKALRTTLTTEDQARIRATMFQEQPAD